MNRRIRVLLRRTCPKKITSIFKGRCQRKLTEYTRADTPEEEEFLTRRVAYAYAPRKRRLLLPRSRAREPQEGEMKQDKRPLPARSGRPPELQEEKQYRQKKTGALGKIISFFQRSMPLVEESYVIEMDERQKQEIARLLWESICRIESLLDGRTDSFWDDWSEVQHKRSQSEIWRVYEAQHKRRLP